jgi:hypothetical protein
MDKMEWIHFGFVKTMTRTQSTCCIVKSQARPERRGKSTTHREITNLHTKWKALHLSFPVAVRYQKYALFGDGGDLVSTSQ